MAFKKKGVTGGGGTSVTFIGDCKNKKSWSKSVRGENFKVGVRTTIDKGYGFRPFQKKRTVPTKVTTIGLLKNRDGYLVRVAKKGIKKKKVQRKS